jgi:hypothetical protein
VKARDAHGNVVPVRELEATAGTGNVLVVLEAGADSRGGTVTLRPRRSGRAVLEIVVGGVRDSLAAQVVLPRRAGGAWLVGSRVSVVGFKYDFRHAPDIRGHAGFCGEVFGGRALGSSLRLKGVLGVGSLQAAAAEGDLSISLVQGYVQAEYALRREGQVIPVILLGAGSYRIRSDDPNTVVYHSSVFFTVGGGVDVVLGPRLTGEARVATQQLNEMNGSLANGYVGSINVVQVGVRMTP